MSQQQQPPRQGTSQQQYYDQYQHLIPQSGVEFDEDLTAELRVAIHDLEDVTRKTKWCIDKMIDEGPEMASCVRACRDVGRIADLTVDYISTDSIYTLQGALTFMSVAEDALEEIQRHGNPHCQETADAVGRCLDSVWNVLSAFVDPQQLQQLHQRTMQLTQQGRQSQQLPHSLSQPQGGQHQHQHGAQGGQRSQQPRGTQQMQTQPMQGGQQTQQPPTGSGSRGGYGEQGF